MGGESLSAPSTLASQPPFNLRCSRCCPGPAAKQTKKAGSESGKFLAAWGATRCSCAGRQAGMWQAVLPPPAQHQASKCSPRPTLLFSPMLPSPCKPEAAAVGFVGAWGTWHSVRSTQSCTNLKRPILACSTVNHAATTQGNGLCAPSTTGQAAQPPYLVAGPLVAVPVVEYTDIAHACTQNHTAVSSQECSRPGL